MIISVIIPIYKGKKYIAGLTSIFKNNLKKLKGDFSLEVIFVNDYPEEDLTLTIDDAKEHFSDGRMELRCINNTVNCGIHLSRIKGIKESVGEYVFMLDQDDKIREDYLSSQLACIGNADLVVANGITELPAGNRQLYKFGIMQETVKSAWFNSVFNCRITSPGQCLIRKTAIPKEWLDNPVKNNGSDDYMLWLMMLSKGVKISLNRKPVYIHCYTGNNTSLDNGLINKSVREVLRIGRETKSIKKRYIKLIEKRLMHETGEKRSLFYSLEEFARGVGERMNKI